MKTNLNTKPTPKPSTSYKTQPESMENEPVPIVVVHPPAPPKRKAATAEGGSQKRRKASSIPNWHYTLGFHINYDWCAACKFSDFLSLIEYQQWVYLFHNCSNSPVYRNLLFEFKDTFKYENGVCSAIVKGTKINFDAQYLADLFQVPNFGQCSYLKYKQAVQIGTSNESKIVKFIGGNPRVVTSNHRVLSPLHKLLFTFTWKGILPRLQNGSTVSLLDATIIYCLANKIQINFPKLMIEHLVYYAEKTTIPYGPLLTVLFQSFGISVESETPTYIKPENILSKQSLLWLGLEIEGGKIQFITRTKDGKQKTKKEGKEKKRKGKVGEGDEPNLESEEDKDEGDGSEGDSSKGVGEGVHSEWESSTDTESEEERTLTPVFHEGLRRSKRIFVKTNFPTPSSRLEPVIIEDTSSSHHSDPDVPPACDIFESEPTSVPDQSPPKQPAPTSSSPPSNPFGFAAFSGTSAPVSDIQQVKEDLAALSFNVLTKFDEMTRMMKTMGDKIQEQVQEMIKAQDTRIAAAEARITESHKEILETIHKVAFEEVDEKEDEPADPTP